MRIPFSILIIRYFALGFTVASLIVPWVVPLTGARETILVTASVVFAMVFLATYMEEKP